MKGTTIPPEIDSEKCTGCGVCVDACPVFTPGMHGAMTMGYQNIRYCRLIERKRPHVQWR